MPALVLGPALGAGLLKFPLGGTTLTVLGCEQDGSVLADDLPFPVAEEALGPLVPGAHAPVGVGHEDGVVLRSLNQALEAFLALLERLLQAPLSGLIVVVCTTHAVSLSRTNPASMAYSPECMEGVSPNFAASSNTHAIARTRTLNGAPASAPVRPWL